MNRVILPYSPPGIIIYLDVASCLLDDEGHPDEKCFVNDGLHLTDEGYERWTRIVQAYLVEEYPTTP